jgi:glycine betaine/proline transport system ATP-binding protein
MQDEFMRLQAVLKKTIVFITHDFDEAIRLADKIAIMKDGKVVQQGTPEDIVLHPATDYVAEFTRAVPRAKVVRVASVMKPAAGTEPAQSINSHAKVADAAPLFLHQARLRVVGAQGETLGHLLRDDVVALMLGG